MSGRIIVRLVMGLVLIPCAAWAQSANGGIAGVVKDASGGVLPGVTVEASSPVLIEKVRVVTTDGSGNYKIVELRPGTYSVTFTLPGFSPLKREGIELAPGFAATVNAEMRLGSLEETITVTSDSPVVDIYSTQHQSVLSREVLDTLPSGKTISAFATLTLGTGQFQGVVYDVGGSKGEQNNAFGVHGSRSTDSKVIQDGMQYSGSQGRGDTFSRTNQINQAAVQEITLQTSGMSAESETGGVQIQLVPKEGGNRLKLYLSANGSAPGLQSSNLTDEIRRRGVDAVGALKQLYDFGVGLGGPIAQDKLWFYVAHRTWAAQNYNAGRYFNKTVDEFWYTPDFSRQAFNENSNQDTQVRLTWQASAKNKFAVSTGLQDNCNCYKVSTLVDVNRSPEASVDTRYYPQVLTQGTWTYPATNRLLLEAGVTYNYAAARSIRVAGATRTSIAKEELTTGFKWGALTQGLGYHVTNYTGEDAPSLFNQGNQRFALSYVTGSHAFKAGVTVLEALGQVNVVLNDPPVVYHFNNGAPSRITEWASPSFTRNSAVALGIFAQDQLTMSRLTLNLGVRFDSLNGKALAASNPGGMFRPATDYPAVEDVPSWRDISPRLGGSFDLFGNGKTALKASLGRYVLAELSGIAASNNPGSRITESATRTWNDANQNLVPDCVLTNPLLNGECGQISNLNLGKPVLGTTYDPALLLGWGVRPYQWHGSASLQHELLPSVALSVGYFRTSFGNFSVTDNLAITPGDHSPYCITAPVDSRLPDGGGNKLCGLYDIKPEKFGLVDNFVTNASNFGEQSEVYNGLEFGVDGHFGGGRVLQGGVSFGRTVTDNCFVVDSPQQERPGFCHVSQPWSSTAQVKAAGAYPLPWDMQVSGTFQNISTRPILANLVVSNAAIAPELGRNLGQCRNSATCNGTVTVPLIAPSTMFGDRLTQVDLRLTKGLSIRGARLRTMVDVYNVFNASTMLDLSTGYSSTWLKPLEILSGRLVKFGAQLDW
jgi:hypothetical protein